MMSELMELKIKFPYINIEDIQVIYEKGIRLVIEKEVKPWPATI